MKNVAKILSMFSVHPVLFLAFLYFALPILIYAFIFDVLVKYVIPLLEYIFTPIFKYTRRKVNRVGTKIYRRLSNPRKIIRDCKSIFLKRKRLKLTKNKEKLLKKELKIKRAKTNSDALYAKKERAKRRIRQKENYERAKSSLKMEKNIKLAIHNKIKKVE